MPGAGQRRPGAALRGGPDARPEPGPQVVGVGAGDDVGDAEPRRQRGRGRRPARPCRTRSGRRRWPGSPRGTARRWRGKLVPDPQRRAEGRGARARSAAGRLGETAVAATTRSAPRARTAAASTTPESTPPENATSTPGSGASCAARASSRSSSVLTTGRLLTPAGSRRPPGRSTRRPRRSATSRPSRVDGGVRPGRPGRRRSAGRRRARGPPRR